jgi:hypothetical protein
MNANNYIQEDVINSCESIDLTLTNISKASDNLIAITDKICSSITTWKEMDLQMRQMEMHFNTYMAGIEKELSIYKSRLPIVEKQLDNLNVQMSKVLDSVLAMGTETEAEISLKLRLLETVEKHLDNMSAFAMKLL